MKVPKYIQAKMHRLARLSSEAAQLSQTIDEYFGSRGYNNDFGSKRSLRSGDGVGLEELELGNDVTEQFVEAFERGEYELYAPCLIGDTVYFVADTIDGWKIRQGKVVKLKSHHGNKSADSKGLITVQCEPYAESHPKASDYVPFYSVYFSYEDFGINFFTNYEDAEKDLEAVIKADEAFIKKNSLYN